MTGRAGGRASTSARRARARRRSLADGKPHATSYVAAHALLPAPRLGRAGAARVAGRRRPGAGRGRRRGRRIGDPGRSRSDRSSTAWCRLTADGEATGPALIWMDRRAGCGVRGRGRPASGPERLREITGCNLDPGHVAAKIAWLAGNRPEQHAGAPAGSCCRARSSPGTRPASWRSIRPTPRRRCCSTFAGATGRTRWATRSASTRRRWPPVRPAAPACSARSRRGCARPPASTRAPRSCSAAATRWRRRSAPVWSSRGSSAT